MMDFFAGPSFHEGNGSAARAMVVIVKANAARSAAAMMWYLDAIIIFDFLALQHWLRPMRIVIH